MPKYEAVDLPKKYEAVDLGSATPVNPYQHPGGGSGAPYTQTREEKIDTALTALPAVAATVATLPVSGPAAFGGLAATGFRGLVQSALLRTAIGAQAGGTGSLLASGLQTALDTPGKPAGLRDAAIRAATSAAVEGGTQLGEIGRAHV